MFVYRSKKKLGARDLHIMLLSVMGSVKIDAATAVHLGFTMEICGNLKAENALVNRYATSPNASFIFLFIRVNIFPCGFGLKAVKTRRDCSSKIHRSAQLLQQIWTASQFVSIRYHDTTLFNLLAMELNIYILAHHLCKM